MKKLLIIGAGGFGREVLGYALDIKRENRDWELYGFLDDNPDALDNYNCEYKVVGPIHDHIIQEDEIYVCALGDPKAKLKIGRDFKARGAVFANIIHPTARIGRTSVYGQGLIMCPYSIITENVKIGEFNTINLFSGYGHNAIAEDGCTLSSHCDVTGYAYLEEGVFLGSNVSILPGVRVGKYSRIGAGSIVLKNVPAYVTMFGNPANKIF